MGNAPAAVKRPVDRFDLGRKVFQSGDYKEEQLRAEFGQRTCRLRFLIPFFTALARFFGAVGLEADGASANWKHQEVV